MSDPVAVEVVGGYVVIEDSGIVDAVISQHPQEVAVVLAGTQGPAGVAGAGVGTLIVGTSSGDSTPVALDGTLRPVFDYAGTASPLWLSTLRASLDAQQRVTLRTNDGTSEVVMTDGEIASAGAWTHSGGNFVVDGGSHLKVVGGGDLYVGQSGELGASDLYLVGADIVAYNNIATAVDWMWDSGNNDHLYSSAVALKWSSTSEAAGVKDLGLARDNDGTYSYLRVTDGSTGYGRARAYGVFGTYVGVAMYDTAVRCTDQAGAGYSQFLAAYATFFNGGRSIRIQPSNGIDLGSYEGIYFTTGSDYYHTRDIGLVRYNDGVRTWLKVTDGSTGHGYIQAEYVSVGGSDGIYLYQVDANFVGLYRLDGYTAGLSCNYLIGGSYVAAGVVRPWAGGGTTPLYLSDESYANTVDAVRLATGTRTHSTGEAVAVKVAHVWSDTGDASAIDLLIDSTESGRTSSGTHRLIDLRVGGVSRFYITATYGEMYIPSGAIYLLSGTSAVTLGSTIHLNAFTGVNLGSGMPLLWPNTSAYTGTKDTGLARYNDGVRTWLGVSDGATAGLGLVYADKLAFGNAITPFVLEGRDSNFCVLNLLSSIGNSGGTGGLMLKYLLTTAGYVSTQLMTATSGIATPTIGSLGNDQTIDIASTRLWTVAGNAVEMAQTTFSASSGTQAAVAILPTYNASGTASGIDLYLNRTETAVGSGPQYLIWASVGGVEKFSVTTAGALNAANRIGSPIIQDPTGHFFAYGSYVGLGPGWAIGWGTTSGYDTKDLVIDRHDSGTAIYLDVSTGGGVRVPAGTATDPSLVIGTTNTGWYGVGTNRVRMAQSGVAFAEFGLLADGVSSGLYIIANNGPGLAKETASATNPTVLPDCANSDTGIGAVVGSDILCLIANATEVVRVESTGITVNGTATSKLKSIDGSATKTLTAAECSGTIVDTYGQAAECTLTLPAAASGLNIIVAIGTSGAGAVHVKAGASDKLYLDGVALDDGDKASLSSPALGDTLTLAAFQTGASSWDWIAVSGPTAWTDGGA